MAVDDQPDARRHQSDAPAGADAVTATFVALSDTLVHDIDVIEFLQSVTDRCVELLAVEAAGLVLTDPLGRIRYMSACPLEERLVDLIHLQDTQSPCRDAIHGDLSVLPQARR